MKLIRISALQWRSVLYGNSRMKRPIVYWWTLPLLFTEPVNLSLSCAGSILSLLFYFWWQILLANNVDPDLTPHNLLRVCTVILCSFYGFAGKNGQCVDWKSAGQEDWQSYIRHTSIKKLNICVLVLRWSHLSSLSTCTNARLIIFM